MISSEEEGQTTEEVVEETTEATTETTTEEATTEATTEEAKADVPAGNSHTSKPNSSATKPSSKPSTNPGTTRTIVPKTTEAATTQAAAPEGTKTDFLAANGITITPNGSMTMTLAKTDTEETIDVNATTSVTTVASSEAGYSDTIFVLEIPNGVDDIAFSWYFTAFDRYTGIDFESHYFDYGSTDGTDYSDATVIDIDGKQYDCSWDSSRETIGSTIKTTMTIHHPSEYDGVVFQVSKLTASQ